MNRVGSLRTGLQTLVLVLCLWRHVYGIQLLTEPSTGVAVLNKPFMFHCQAESDNQSVTYTWRVGEADVNLNATDSLANRVVYPNGSLLIRAVTASDVKPYTCVASAAGASVTSARVQLLLAERPRFVRTPHNMTAELGDTVHLPCHVTGLPSPAVQWTTPQSVILPMPSQAGNTSVNMSGTLTIARVTAQDQGRYTCLASNIAGWVTALVVLQVEGPPYFTAQPASHIALAGETTIFSCHASGYPTPQVTWYRENQEQPLQQNSSLLLSSEGDLTLVKVALTDEGTFRCEVNSTKGRRQALATLTVHALPTFVEAPSSQRVVLGQTVHLRCRVSGVPPPSQRWLRAGRTLTIGDNISLDEDHTVTITAITRDQLGQYTCMAQNQAGVRAVSASVYLSGQPYFSTLPLNTTVNVSSPLSLSCRAQQSTLEEALRPALCWFRGIRGDGAGVLIDVIDQSGDDVTDGDANGTRRYWATSNGDLVFERVMAQDEGWYYCSAVNPQTSVFADPVYIKVQVPPVVLAISSPTSTPYQGQANITCRAVGDPDPLIMWISPQGHMMAESVPGYQVEGGMLAIQRAINENDGGMWTCKVCNLLGCDSAHTFLGVQGRPVIRRVDVTHNSSNIQLACVAVGLPPPVLLYTSQGNSVNESRGHYFSASGLYVEREWVKNTYTCLAVNDHGEDTLNLTAPHTPQLTAAKPHSTSALLTVSTREGLSDALPVEGITVEYRQWADRDWSSQYTSVPSTTPQPGTQAPEMGVKSSRLEVELTGLVPYSVYLVRVKVVNVLADSAASDHSVQILTLPHTPPPPSNVTVTSENSQIVVTWVTPSHLNGNIDNIFFKVKITNSSGVVVAQMSIAARNSSTARVSDLDLGTHTVILWTYSSQVNKTSEEVTSIVQVTQSVPRFVPSAVSVRAVNDTAIQISWQTAQDTADVRPPVEGYTVRVESVSLSSPLQFWISGPRAYSHVITGLQERSQYSCTVAAFNRGGTGPFSASVTGVTYYGLFSRLAYKNDLPLALSGKWVAVLASCLAAVIFVLIIIYIVRTWRALHHGNSLDLSQPSQGPDPFDFEPGNVEVICGARGEVFY